MKSFQECWAWIKQACVEDWILESRQIRMGDCSPEYILNRIMEENGELSQAHTRDGNDLEEIADCFSILMHYAVQKGFSPAEICEEMTRKLETNIKPECGKMILRFCQPDETGKCVHCGRPEERK